MRHISQYKQVLELVENKKLAIALGRGMFRAHHQGVESGGQGTPEADSPH